MPLTLDSPSPQIDPRSPPEPARAPAKGVEPRTAAEVLVEAFDIDTVGALLHHYPRRYIDRSRVQTIRDLKIGAYVTVIARVRKVAKRQTRRQPDDGHGDARRRHGIPGPHVLQPAVGRPRMYKEGQEVAVSGVATLYQGRLQLSNQEVELLRGDEADLVHTGRITPVHPATEGITTRTIRELIHRALEQLPALDDPMPADVIDAASRSARTTGRMRDIHFPETTARSRSARAAEVRRAVHAGAGRRVPQAPRGGRAAGGGARRRTARSPAASLATLPFEPTDAQRRAMDEIGAAMARPRPMNVLLQGDVGAGKTLVALHAALIAIGSGHQAAIMAPTEVLAGQHFRSVAALLGGRGGASPTSTSWPRARPAAPDGQASLLDPLEADGRARRHSPGLVTYALLTAAVTGKDRAARARRASPTGEVDLVVGTHALVQEAVDVRRPLARRGRRATSVRAAPAHRR